MPGSRILFRAGLALLPGALGWVLSPGPLQARQGVSRIQEEAPPAPSVVRGLVVDQESGDPLGDVAVSLASGPGGTPGIGTRVTNAEGLFLFREVPPGSYRIIATLIGYRDRRDTLEVAPGSELYVHLPLSVSPVALEPIMVEVTQHVANPMRDFEARRKTLSGTFFDREQIERRNPLVFTDLLRMVPGARMVPNPPYGPRILLRGGCQPRLWVDGMPVASEPSADALVQPLDLEAVEVYRGVETPAEFGPTSCGAIIVWTRRGEPMQGGGSFWKRLLAGIAILGLGYIISR